MNPLKVDRNKLQTLTDLPNVGKAMAADLHLLGIHEPNDLLGRDAVQLYKDLCHVTNARHDPCVLDVFISIVRFMQGEPAQPWWDYTAERKALKVSLE
ncbi:MAG: helix-hairpin-helix domain-containing protein [Cellvibrio sp.]